ncbi:hypothetical protein MNBD_GAMMA01-1220, partial [hydrothermal vent metagenome]
MQNIALLFSGFSVFYALVFILTHCNNEHGVAQHKTGAFAVILMCSLAALQIYHYAYLQFDSAGISTWLYLVLLYSVAPVFYFYARAVLKAEERFDVVQLLHFLPVMFIFVFDYSLAFTLAFVVGSGYLSWLLKTVYVLRTHKDKFKPEIVLLTIVFFIAIGVSIMALTMPISPKLFYALYTSAIGFALFVVALIVSNKPKIAKTLSAVVKATYAVSTLTAIDCDAKLSKLAALMTEDKLYQQHNLDRQTIAAELDLSAHQLSELINSKLGVSFSRYLRQQRINAAKRLLLTQPKASVLAIGLDVGFASQSNFYEAF